MADRELDKEILDAYSDAGLVVLVCLKLEAVLTELLAQFCHLGSDDVIFYYHGKYPSGITENMTFYVREKMYSRILKENCKMALGNLIHELFVNKNPNNSEDSKSPADHMKLDREEISKFSQINRLRNKIAHYGKDTDGSSILNHLSNDERQKIVSYYKIIIEKSQTFTKAYPQNVVEMRQCFGKVTQAEDFRAVVEVLHEQLITTKRRLEECIRNNQSKQEELKSSKNQIIDLESQVQNLKDRCVKAENQLTDLKVESKDEVSRLRAELRTYEDTMKKLENDKQRAERKLLSLTEEDKQRQEATATLNQRIVQLETENDKLNKLALGSLTLVTRSVNQEEQNTDPNNVQTGIQLATSKVIATERHNNASVTKVETEFDEECISAKPKEHSSIEYDTCEQKK